MNCHNNDKYNLFENENLNYYDTPTFKSCNFGYLEMSDPPYASWFYGDSIDLKINLNQFKETEDDFRSYTRQFKFEFLNFRYETIYTDTYELTINNSISSDADLLDITISIDDTDSAKYFKKGYYYLKVTMIDVLDSEGTYRQQLFMPKECTLWVK